MRRTLAVLLSTCSLAALTAFLTLAPTSAAHADEAAPIDTGRVIVKWKSGSKMLSTPGQQAPERAKALGRRVGMSLQSGIAITENLQVMTATGMSSRRLAARLAQESDVEYAVEDQRRYRTEVPLDPLYINPPAPAPAAGQWYLRPPASDIPAAINAQDAWDITTGSPTVVVADLDSGVRYDHQDLAANLLPGYDMITNVATANDGDGRDADASDPGDWVSETEAFTRGGAFAGCTVEDSSWHGTQTAALIAATTNNNLGMASVGRNVKLLPIRVLGKCGGYDSDIVAGMRWAVGLQVPGLPLNPNPARIINMSLGSAGACSQAYVSAIADVAATGALIIASAGNSAGHSVSTPANCPGIFAVGGLRHVGTKVGYSDVGPEIGISAPAGNCVSSNGACLYPILTATNDGTTTPIAGSSSYTGSGNNASLGTSFSAPLVAGTAALIWSIRPGLTRDEVKSVLTGSARPFPTSGTDTTGTVPACHPSNGADQLECYCTASTCGAGMLDAAGAASLATRGLYARITSDPTPAIAGQTITLSASTSLVAADRTVASYTWALASGGGIVNGFTGSTNAASTTVLASSNGTFTVALTVVDSANASSTVTRTITVGAATASTGAVASSGATVADSGGGGGGALGLASLAFLMLVLVGLAATRHEGHRES